MFDFLFADDAENRCKTASMIMMGKLLLIFYPAHSCIFFARLKKRTAFVISSYDGHPLSDFKIKMVNTVKGN